MALTGFDIFVQASKYVPELLELSREQLHELYLVIPYENQPDETGRIVYEAKAKELNRDPGLAVYDKFEVEITRVTRQVPVIPQVSQVPQVPQVPQVIPRVLPPQVIPQVIPQVLPPRIIPPPILLPLLPKSIPSI